MFSNKKLLELSQSNEVPDAQVQMAKLWLAERQSRPEVEQFLADVRAEHVRACQKFPASDVVMNALTEEVGELAKALMDEPWDHVRAEAVQVASTAMRVALEGDPTIDPTRIKRGQLPFQKPHA